MKLGGNPFRTILNISFFEAHFLGVAGPKPIRDWTAVHPRIREAGCLGGVRGGVAPPGEIDLLPSVRESG